LYTEPEHGQDTSRCNTEVGKVITKSRADDDAERNMEVSTHRSIEDNRNSNAKTTNGHDWNSITPGQADLNDRAGSFPSPQVNNIGCPTVVSSISGATVSDMAAKLTMLSKSTCPMFGLRWAQDPYLCSSRHNQAQLSTPASVVPRLRESCIFS
jgi:hypothetical protein